MRGFRVYNTDLKKYVTEEECFLVNSRGNLCMLDYDLVGTDDCYIVEYYTGLTAKNGKPIFEGDIIEVITTDFEKKRRAAIRYGEFYECNAGDLFLGWYIVANEGECISLLQEDKEIIKMCEVVGNIHDNAELLEVEE